MKRESNNYGRNTEAGENETDQENDPDLSEFDHASRHRSGLMRQRSSWLAVPIVLGLLSLLTAGYLGTFTSATIVDGGRPTQIRTHQNTVGAALREAGVQTVPEDLVSPGLDQPLNHNGQINIQRAKLVRVQFDGQEPKLVRTQRLNGPEILAELGVPIGVNDFLSVKGALADNLLPLLPNASGKPAAELFFRKAVPISIVEQANTRPVLVNTSARTVGEALMQAGHLIYLADTITPPSNALVTPNMQIAIVRAKPVSVVVDGRRIRTRTHQQTVGQLLAEMNVVLFDQDFARPSLDTPVTSDTEVRVVRVTHEIEVQQDFIPSETRWEPDPATEIDNEFVGQEGSPGVREMRTLVSYEDGNEVKREMVADFQARDPQPKIYKYGTQIVLRTLNTPSGPVTYWRKIRMLATSYSASTAGVSRSVAWYGKVRCGFEMRRGVVAVDPNVVSLNTMVYVPEYGVGHACDTGSAINGNRIDLGYGDDDLQLWYRWTDVYLLSPAPSPGEIDYRLGKNLSLN